MPAEIAKEAQARLDRWKSSLLDLTLRNRLLDARDARTCVALAGVDALALDARLTAAGADGLALGAIDPARAKAEQAIGAARGAEAAEAAAAQALASGQVRVALAVDELGQRATAMARAQREGQREGGTHTLWLALGLLRWTEADAPDDVHEAPLVLRPVELARAGTSWRVIAADDDARVNQTLIERLRAEGVEVPAAAIVEGAPDADDVDVAEVIARVGAAIAGRAGWQVVPAARLGIFSFAKLVMWTDLEERAAELLASPVVAHLAGGGAGALPAPVDDAAAEIVDEAACPLDCDASQLAAVIAGANGQTFVLQGPPGTGKSQTIANLIAVALARGKTVLFASEKIAALEVVQRRLAAAGLGDFCLELHSHKARKRAVITELGRVLERTWRPLTGAAGDAARREALRGELDGFVHGLHAATAAGASVHDALARLGELRGAPRLDGAPTVMALAGVDRAGFAARQQAIATYAQAIAAVAPIAAHPWRASDLADWHLSTGDAVAAVIGEVAAAAADAQAALIDWAAAVPGMTATTAAELDALGALWAVAARTPRPGAELIASALSGNRTDDEDRPRKGRVPLPPKDPAAWLELARRRETLTARLRGRWTDALDALDLDGLAARFRRWAGRFGLWRWFALRGARAQVRGVLAAGATLPDDAAIAGELEAAIDERGVRRTLDGVEPQARRWLGALASDRNDAADLDAIAAALRWAVELRAAFDAAPIVGGERGAREATARAAREAAWRALVAQVAAPSTGDGDAGDVTLLARAAAAAARWRGAIARLREVTGVELAHADATRLPGDGQAGVVARALAATAAWRTQVPALREWAAYVRARREASVLGLDAIVGAAERGAIAPADLPAAWERAALLAVTEARIDGDADLRGFHGASHHAKVAEFADLDRGSLAVARAGIIAKLTERVPRVTADVAADPSGELGVLLRELKKQRNHKPLRALFRAIPNVLPRLKPCLLMSPLSVAQYLDPALPRFDLVVFDEASQIPTADAIGALARGASAVVVGDSKQLPPTRFFFSGASGGAGGAAGATDADDDGETIEELESILDECVAARVPELRLGWHYRSRHEDLIAFSNARYYGDRLSVFPAAATRTGELGVAWRKVDGVYDRAATRTNRAEAVAVVADVLARLRDPIQQKRSIGVVTFSRPQQDLIEDLLDDARAAEPALDAFFADDVAEPVLIKNLETIQGDERDVVLFSIGYGPDAAGKLALNFGPLNQEGGERRLNVAVTRAREQLVIFSTLEPEMIDAEVAPLGVRHLRELLVFARAGGGAGRPADDGAAATPTTAAIAKALVERGWTVRHQIGCAGYRLDLAVVDPADPGRYVLAIEADGPAYASAATARDRDRLRALVLGGLGWRLHCIWSLDWWADPDKEIQRAHAAIITAIAAARAQTRPARTTASGRVASATTPPAMAAPTLAPSTASGPVPTAPAVASGSGSGRGVEAARARATTGAPGSGPSGASGSGRAARPSSEITVPTTISERTARASTPPGVGGPAVQKYVAASVPAGRRTPDDLFGEKYAHEVGRTIEAVLAAEAPMHVELLARRVGAYFGVGRVNDKVSERVRALVIGRGRFGAGADADIVWRADQDPTALPAVRVAGEAAESKRDVDEVPLAEIAAAAAVVLNRAVGATVDELVRDTARLLGFARATERIGKRVRAGVDELVARGGCALDGDRAALP